MSLIPCSGCGKGIKKVGHRTDGVICDQCIKEKGKQKDVLGMKDQKIYYQAVIEIVNNKENENLKAGDIVRLASLAEKFYRQGYEDASNK